VLLQLQFGQELARRYEQEHIAIELRAADLASREARAEELRARIRELERALSQSLGDRSASTPTGPVPQAGQEPPTTPRPKRRRLGRRLVRHRVVTKRAVRDALAKQKRTGEPLGRILVDAGAITPATLLVELARQHDVAIVTPDDRGIALLPSGSAVEHSAVALAVGPRPVAPGALTAVGLVDLVHARAVSAVLGRAIEPRLTDIDTFTRLFTEAYGVKPPKIAPVAAPPAPEPASVPEVAPAVEPSSNGASSANGTPVAVAPSLATEHPAARRRWAGRRVPRPAVERPAVERATGETAEAEVEPALPTTTILVALHRATAILVAPLADALERLDYPRHRLQVMAVHDPADAVTQRTLRTVELPAWVSSLPPAPWAEAGPRGLLLRGLREASGELLTVVQSAGQLPRGGLRAVAQGEDPDRLLVSSEAEDGLTTGELANAYLHQADEMQRASIVGPRGTVALPLVVFRTAQLSAAFGWNGHLVH
jgi:hypothetical protein